MLFIRITGYEIKQFFSLSHTNRIVTYETCGIRNMSPKNLQTRTYTYLHTYDVMK